MEALERKKIADQTLLVFTSDNGPENTAYERIRKHGHYSMAHLRGLKRDLWEGGHRIPFIARWPGVVPAGTECGQLVSLGDLMATCTDLLGVPLPEGGGEDSASILPLLRGETHRPVREFAVHHSLSGKLAIRRGDWVFIDAPSGDDNQEPEWFKQERGYAAHDHPGELFHLGDDLSERRNLYGERPEVVAELSALLEQVKRGAFPTAASREIRGPLSE